MAGDYGVFIWSAYGVTGLTVVSLILWAVLDFRAQARALTQLQARAGSAPAQADAHSATGSPMRSPAHG